MKLLLLLLLLLLHVLCEDYYQLLGVPRKATDEQIRKAFKKLSLKYHPDKNKQNIEQAQAQFQKIVAAYEVLKDPEQRQIYDKYGEEGLKKQQQQQNQQQYYNYNDVFARFFQNQNGNPQGQQASSLFKNTDVEEIDMTTINKFFRRENVWLVLFYKADDRGKQLKQIWVDLASKYYDIFRVAAINCAAEAEICDDEFQVYEYPGIFAFPANIRQEAKEFKGTKTTDELAKFAISFMESFVSIVTSDNYPSFIQQDTQHLVLLFTNKTSTPPLFKVLSKEFKGKLIFGQVRSSDTKLVEQFKVTSFPKLLVLTDPDAYQGVAYDSNDFKKDQIKKFLREYAYVTKKQKKRSSIPKELTTSLVKSGSCSSRDNNLCLILINDGGDPLEILNPLSQYYSQEDKIGFYYVQKNNLIYSQIFGEIESFPAILVVKPKKDRFSLYSGEQSFEKVKDYIDSIISGNVQFKPMKDSLEYNLFQDDL